MVSYNLLELYQRIRVVFQSARTADKSVVTLRSTNSFYGISGKRNMLEGGPDCVYLNANLN